MTARKPQKPQRPAKFTSAQNRSFQAFVRAHPFTHAGFLHFVATHKAQAAKPKKPSRPRKAPAPASGTSWPLAMNDELETCTMAAIGCSLLASQNTSVPGSILASYGESLGLREAFESVSSAGLYGYALKNALAVPEGLAGCVPGLVIGMKLPDGSPHAAMTLGSGMMASWGGAVPLEGTVEEAWMLTWEAGSS